MNIQEQIQYLREQAEICYRAAEKSNIQGRAFESEAAYLKEQEETRRRDNEQP